MNVLSAISILLLASVGWVVGTNLLFFATCQVVSWFGARAAGARRLVCRLSGMRYLGTEPVCFQQGDSDCGTQAMATACRALGLEALGNDRLRGFQGSSLLDLWEAGDRLGLRVQGMDFPDLDAASCLLSVPGNLLIVLLGWDYLLPKAGLAALPLRLLGLLCGEGLNRIGHWVVVRRINSAEVEILDPYLGHVAMARQRLADSWKNRALAVGRPEREAGS
jgi:ABC-type bacteriocin/lantibiotic exporter with double-glycine peptidase domain